MVKPGIIGQGLLSCDTRLAQRVPLGTGSRTAVARTRGRVCCAGLAQRGITLAVRQAALAHAGRVDTLVGLYWINKGREIMSGKPPQDSLQTCPGCVPTAISELGAQGGMLARARRARHVLLGRI